MPVSPVSGRLDAFQWKVPLAELGDAREVIDSDEIGARETPPKTVTPPSLAPPPELPARVEEPAAPAASAPEPRPTAAPAASPPKPPKIAPRAEAVIPLLHVPDDPGPEPAPDLDPEPGPTGGSRGLRLFK